MENGELLARQQIRNKKSEMKNKKSEINLRRGAGKTTFLVLVREKAMFRIPAFLKRI
jgi:hypothetical protein